MSVRHSLLLAALLLAACSDDDGDGGQEPQEPTDGDVQVRDNVFDPAALEITPGATVVWTWSATQTHNVTFDDGEQSEDQSSGTYERTFAAPGTYPYHCTFHGTPTSGMRGAVTVAEAADETGGNDGGNGGGYDGY